jgi:hypothetical protein
VHGNTFAVLCNTGKHISTLCRHSVGFLYAQPGALCSSKWALKVKKFHGAQSLDCIAINGRFPCGRNKLHYAIHMYFMVNMKVTLLGFCFSWLLRNVGWYLLLTFREHHRCHFRRASSLIQCAVLSRWWSHITFACQKL